VAQARKERNVDRLWRAAVNSWKGLLFALRSERAFQQELIVLVIAVPLAFLLTGSATQRFMLIGSVLFLMVVELLNTAVEKLADRVTRERDPEIGRVKDMGSAAVGVAILLVAAVWLWAFAGWFWR
jgi:diacylglycerol kinase (ATP)